MIGSLALYMPILSQRYCQIPTLIKPQAQRILGGRGDVFYKEKKKKRPPKKKNTNSMFPVTWNLEYPGPPVS